MNKKGFSLIELIVCIAIIAIITGITVPILHGFIERAKILDANTKARAISNAINIYLTELNASDNGMIHNGKYMYIAIAAGSDSLAFDDSFFSEKHGCITVRNDFLKDEIKDTEIINSSWKTPYKEHLLNIAIKINDIFNGKFRSCFIIAVLRDNTAVQVYYIPDIDKLSLTPNYNRPVY